MSQNIPLESIPNQQFNIPLGGSIYDITLKTFKNITFFDLLKDQNSLLSSSRVVPGIPLIPYTYLEDGGGNFIFITKSEEYPIYHKFGMNQFLLFFSRQELDSIRGN